MHTNTHICIHMYMYIYREREKYRQTAGTRIIYFNTEPFSYLHFFGLNLVGNLRGKCVSGQPLANYLALINAAIEKILKFLGFSA